jgi:hypothetical protein
MSQSRIIENVAPAHRLNEEVAVSDFNHAAWERARPVQLARYWSGEDAPPERQAEARLLWSDEALWARFVCRQAEPPVLSPTPRTEEKTIGLWDRDVCEIFIAPKVSEPENYYEFEAAPTGEWIDLKIAWKPEQRRTDWRYHSGMTTASRIEEGRVLTVMRVPWEAFGRKPRAGERWRANLTRCVGRDPDRGYVVWQPTRTVEPNFHLPQAFGWLRFDE